MMGKILLRLGHHARGPSLPFCLNLHQGAKQEEVEREDENQEYEDCRVQRTIQADHLSAHESPRRHPQLGRPQAIRISGYQKTQKLSQGIPTVKEFPGAAHDILSV